MSKKRFVFQITSGVHSEGGIVYGPDYTDEKEPDPEKQVKRSQSGGCRIKTNTNLASKYNVPRCAARFLRLEDRGPQKETPPDVTKDAPNLEGMNAKQLKAFAKKNEIDLGDAVGEEQFRNVIQLSLDVA